MADNGGLYLSPDFSDFGDKGAAEVAALIAHYAEQVAGRKALRRLRLDGRLALLEACGRQTTVAKRLSRPAAARLALGRRISCRSAAFKQKVPVFFGHGSRDTVFPVEKQEAFFRSIAREIAAIRRASCASRPARMARRSA